MTSKELRQKRAKLIEDARALANKPDATAEDHARADEMLNESDAMLAQVTRLERADSLFEGLGTEINARAAVQTQGGVEPVTHGRQMEIVSRLRALGGFTKLSDQDQRDAVEVIARDKRILRAMAGQAIGRLSPEDQAHYAANFGVIQAAGNEASNSAGGYTVAPLFEADLLIALKQWGGMRRVARNIQTATGASLPWPTMDDTANVATILATENTTVGTGTDLAFGQTSLGAYTYVSGALPVSLQLLQDSAFDFDSLVRNAIVVRFGRGQNAHFTTGTGTGQPQGAVTGAASGTVGATGQTLSIIYDDVINLEHSVDPAYRDGSVFMMHDSSVKVLRKLKDTQGHPLWEPSLTAGAPDTLIRRPIMVNQDMPVMAANAKSVLFGNFSNYIIRDTLGLQMMVLRERYADLLQVAWIAYMRSDGKLVSAASPIKYYANSAT